MREWAACTPRTSQWKDWGEVSPPLDDLDTVALLEKSV